MKNKFPKDPQECQAYRQKARKRLKKFNSQDTSLQRCKRGKIHLECMDQAWKTSQDNVFSALNSQVFKVQLCHSNQLKRKSTTISLLII